MRTHSHVTSRVAALVSGTALVLTSASCGAERGGAPANDSMAAAPPRAEVVSDMPAAIAVERDAAPVSAFKASASRQSSAAPGSASAMTGVASTATIIRTGTASLQVDSLEAAMSAVAAIATSLGGWVGSSSMTGGIEQNRAATLELKIPAVRYDEALRGLRPVGRLEAVNTSAEDVGEELVDLRARIDNAHRLEARLATLLAQRTGKLEEALAVERELARVREEIERFEGRLRFLQARTAFSTLTVTVHEPFPVIGAHPGASPIGEAFRQAWRNFVGLTAAVIASLGVVIPVGAAVAAAWVALRRRRSPTPAAS